MHSNRKQDFTLTESGWPHPGAQSISLTLAVRLVRSYGDRLPNAKRVMNDFGVSRATAYRWVAALREA